MQIASNRSAITFFACLTGVMSALSIAACLHFAHLRYQLQPQIHYFEEVWEIHALDHETSMDFVRALPEAAMDKSWKNQFLDTKEALFQQSTKYKDAIFQEALILIIGSIQSGASGFMFFIISIWLIKNRKTREIASSGG